MKKYVLKFRMSETALPRVNALWEALKTAEGEEIELIEILPEPRLAARRRRRSAGSDLPLGIGRDQGHQEDERAGRL